MRAGKGYFQRDQPILRTGGSSGRHVPAVEMFDTESDATEKLGLLSELHTKIVVRLSPTQHCVAQGLRWSKEIRSTLKGITCSQRWSFAVIATLLLLLGAQTHAQTVLTVEEGLAIVAPIYDALSDPSTKNIDKLLETATTKEFQSCSTDTDCVSRDAMAARFKEIGATIPDLHWSIKDIWVSGRYVFVRGQATGTPVKTFLGVGPTGKSFETMSLDVYATREGKIERSYHAENWIAAIRQLGR
jgi:predicted ester cyclase